MYKSRGRIGIDVTDEVRDAMRREATTKNANKNINAKTESISMFDYANEQLKGVSVVKSLSVSA